MLLPEGASGSSPKPSVSPMTSGQATQQQLPCWIPSSAARSSAGSGTPLSSAGSLKTSNPRCDLHACDAVVRRWTLRLYGACRAATRTPTTIGCRSVAVCCILDARYPQSLRWLGARPGQVSGLSFFRSPLTWTVNLSLAVLQRQGQLSGAERSVPYRPDAVDRGDQPCGWAWVRGEQHDLNAQLVSCHAYGFDQVSVVGDYGGHVIAHAKSGSRPAALFSGSSGASLFRLRSVGFASPCPSAVPPRSGLCEIAHEKNWEGGHLAAWADMGLLSSV